MAEKTRIVVCGALAAEALDLLEEAGFEVATFADLDEAALDASSEAAAIIVRSSTQVTAGVMDRMPALKVVGRPGAGIDNVDVEAATARGIVVMNTPGGNAVSVAEHTIALMLALCRDLGRVAPALSQGKWLKKGYRGTELADKTLGVVGLGQIGSEVALRGRGLGMTVIAYDPFVSVPRAAELGVELLGMEDLLARCDVVTLHAPSTPDNEGLIGTDALARMKEGSLLVNTSRGSLVDEAALLSALESGHLGGAALDVFASEPPAPDHPLLSHPRMLATPHIAGSSVEGQVRVGTALARQLTTYLTEGVIINAVNFPSLTESLGAHLRPVMDLAARLGSLLAQLSRIRIEEVGLRYYGEWAGMETAPLTAYALAGVMTAAGGEDVTPVNARSRAAGRGIEVVETRSSRATSYVGLISLQLRGQGRTEWAEGTVIATRPRLTGLAGIQVESDLTGTLLVLRNDDVPGVLGRVASRLGAEGVNIASVALGRREQEAAAPGPDAGPAEETGPGAVGLFCLDSPAAAPVLEALAGLEGVGAVRQVMLP